MGRLHGRIVQTKIVVLHGTVQGFYLVFCNGKQIWISAPFVESQTFALTRNLWNDLLNCTVVSDVHSWVYEQLVRDITVIFSVNISGFTILMEMFSVGKTLPVTVCACGGSGQEILALQYKRLALNDAEQCLSKPHTHTQNIAHLAGSMCWSYLPNAHKRSRWLFMLACCRPLLHVCLERTGDKCCTFYYTAYTLYIFHCGLVWTI